MATDTLLIYCTCPDPESAQHIAEYLVAHQLAACVSIIPQLQSVYRWKGNVESSEELLLLVKSTADAYPALESIILELHPYELPEVIAVPITVGLTQYMAWIKDSVVLPKEPRS